MSILHKLEWRYAVKKFDTDKEVSEDQITELLEATNLMPTAFGLQPFEIIVVKDKLLQQRLFEHSFGQEKVVEASHLVILAAHKKISSEYIRRFREHTEHIRKLPQDTLLGFENHMLSVFEHMSESEHLAWAQRQAYIALGGLLIAAADLKIDSCPMEGFVSEKYDEILELPNGLHTTLVVPLGYRSPEDGLQHLKKSRRELTDIVHLRYEKTEG
jgi:nitroreductase / dihydropteridine reductase